VALITVGSVDDFSVMPALTRPTRLADLGRGVNSVHALSYTSTMVPEEDFDFGISPEPRGIGLQSLQLKKEAQNFLSRLFKRKTMVYYLAWSWDLTRGSGIHVYPDPALMTSEARIPFKSEGVREFLGSGTLLFPTRIVTGGIQLRILIMQSKVRVREFGAAMHDVSAAIQSSDLNLILTGASVAVGVAAPPVLVVTAVKEAVLLLGQAMAPILERCADEVLDLYEGNFPSFEPWPSGRISYEGYGTRVALSHLRR
jgi:hypothetical protein